MKIRCTIAVIGVFALCMLSACKPSRGTAVGPLNSNTVVATVNGQDVLAGQIEEILQTAIRQRADLGLRTTPAQLDQERRRLIEMRITDTLMRGVLATSDVVVTDAEVERQIGLLLTNEYNGVAQLQNALKDNNMTYDQFREGLRMKMALFKLVESDPRFVTSTVTEAQHYYDANSNEYMYPDQLTLHHILLTNSASAQAASNAVMRLADIQKKIAAGLPFDTAAQEYSQCPSAARGGLLGVISRDDQSLPAALVTTAFNLPLSNVSDVVSTEMGAHLLYTTSFLPAHTAAFETVAAEIMEGIDLGTRQQLLQQWAQQLRQNATVIYKK
jgi:parvulin-like peptidyl-prolyl isomerase